MPSIREAREFLVEVAPPRGASVTWMRRRIEEMIEFLFEGKEYGFEEKEESSRFFVSGRGFAAAYVHSERVIALALMTLDLRRKLHRQMEVRRRYLIKHFKKRVNDVPANR